MNPDREKTADSLAGMEKHSEAIEIYRELLEEKGRNIDPGEKSRLEYKNGYSLMHSGQDMKAMLCFRNLIAGHAGEIERELLSDAMTGLGKTYEYTGKHDSAFYWYLEAYRTMDGTDDTLRKARGIRNIAQLLRILKRFDEAKIYCREALEMIQGIGNHKVVANIYNETAYLFEISGELDSAAHYYRKLIDISVSNGYLKGESVGYTNLASVFEKQKRYAEALSLKQQGLEIDRRIGDTYGMMTSWRSLSSTYLLMGNSPEALKALEQALNMCDTVWLLDMAGIQRNFYEIYKARGLYDSALKHYERYDSLRNLINQQESAKQVAELLTRYETEKKEQQILLLAQTNRLKENRIRMQWILIGTLVLLGLFLISTGWFWIRDKNQKMKRMSMELQHFLLREKQDKDRPGNETGTEPSEMYKPWGLTGRESEILYHLGRGGTNATIAEKLFVSENTVKFHIKNIYVKLDVKNRIQALLRCSEDQQGKG